MGNCSSSLIQGIEYYKDKQAEDAIGLMHWDLGGYKPYDLQVVAAFDIDRRKVGQDVAEAIFAPPNCTTVFCDIPQTGVSVEMGAVLDGVAPHMNGADEKYTFVVSDRPEQSKADIVNSLKQSGVEVLVNYLPVGSQEAVEFYAECALDAGVAFVNCIPVFIASQPLWADKFKRHNIPIIGDDIKSQFGATITHRALVDPL